MLRVFQLREDLLCYKQIGLGSFFVICEHRKSSEVEEHVYLDEKQEVFCLIMGDMHAYEEFASAGMDNIQVAQWFVRTYQERKSFDFVKHIRGIFNVVLLVKGELFLINDVLGLSPMYVNRSDNKVFFCTEPEPILEVRNGNVIDRKSIVDFFVYGFVPEGRTFFDGIKNQEPASVLRVGRDKVVVKRYASLQLEDVKGATEVKVVRRLRDVFREAVAVRVPKKDVFLDLTGGRDTRFILANLLLLNKKVTALTVDADQKDTEIACQITKEFRIKHTILNGSVFCPHEEERFGFNYRHSKSIAMLKSGLLSKRSLSGLLGTELLGEMDEGLKSRTSLNYSKVAGDIFKDSFLLKAESSGGSIRGQNLFDGLMVSNLNGGCYLMQICRSYLNVHDNAGWERPTMGFRRGRLFPFADIKVVSLLLSLGPEYLNYKVYDTLYKACFPEFLRFPWRNDEVKKRRVSSGRLKENSLLKGFLSDVEFKNFIKKNGIIKVSPFLLSSRLRELYYFFMWCQANKSARL